MKRIFLLGIDSFLGKKIVNFIKEHDDELTLAGVGVYKDKTSLKELLKIHELSFVYSCLKDEELEKEYTKTKFYTKGIIADFVKEVEFDVLIDATTSFDSLELIVEAIKNKKDIIIGNSEILVGAGRLLKNEVKENATKLAVIGLGNQIIDKCLQNEISIRNIYLPYPKNNDNNILLEDEMSINKLTRIDLSYKIISLHNLYDIPLDNIHPLTTNSDSLSLIVEDDKGMIITKTAGSINDELNSVLLNKEVINHTTSFDLSFNRIDCNRYPLVKVAISLASFGGNFGSILVGANSEAVDLYLKSRIEFSKIEEYIFKTLKDAHYLQEPNLYDLKAHYKWAKDHVKNTWANSK